MLPLVLVAVMITLLLVVIHMCLMHVGNTLRSLMQAFAGAVGILLVPVKIVLLCILLLIMVAITLVIIIILAGIVVVVSRIPLVHLFSFF